MTGMFSGSIRKSLMPCRTAPMLAVGSTGEDMAADGVKGKSQHSQIALDNSPVFLKKKEKREQRA